MVSVALIITGTRASVGQSNIRGLDLVGQGIHADGQAAKKGQHDNGMFLMSGTKRDTVFLQY
jgi:hypothetical protein